MSEERAEPRPGSEPEGAGYGKEWVPAPGVTFLAEGAFVRSVLDATQGRWIGIVAMDVEGKWNHGAKDTLSILMHRDVAAEWGRYLVDAALAAAHDEERARRDGLGNDGAVSDER